MPPHADRWWVKITDFGVTKRIYEWPSGTSTANGTPTYIPPEMQILFSDQCFAADI